MDGVDPLPYEDLASGANGNESARPRLQLEAGITNLRDTAADQIHDGLETRDLTPIGTGKAIPTFNP